MNKPAPATPADRLGEPEIRENLAACPGWTVNARGEITRTYSLSGFAGALHFVNGVGRLAEAADHHPDILIQYRKVTLSLVTHSAGGLTAKDFALARQLDSLAEGKREDAI